MVLSCGVEELTLESRSLGAGVGAGGESPGSGSASLDAGWQQSYSEFDLNEPRDPSTLPPPPSGFPPYPQPPSDCDAGPCLAPCTFDADCPTYAPHCEYPLYLCVQCVTNDTCERSFGPERSVCDAYFCRSCEDDFECGDHRDCRAGTCVWTCDSDSDCARGWSCRSGVCLIGELSDDEP